MPINFSLNRIKEISEGDIDFEQDMLYSFIKEAPNYITELHRYLEQENLEQVQFYYHKLRSALTLFDVDNLEKEFTFVADFKATNDPWKPILIPYVDRVEEAVKQTIQNIKQSLT